MTRFLTLAACAVLTTVAAPAFADNKASTDQLPAALSFLGMDNTSVLSHAQADQVRGQGGFKAKARLNNGAVGYVKVVNSKNVRIGSHNQIKGNGNPHGNGFGRGGFSTVNNGAIGTITVINSKNVRIGSHNKIKF